MKKFIVTATMTQNLSAVVNVPDDWNEAQVMEFYHDNGAHGEFSEDSDDLFGGGGWEWGEASELDADDDSEVVDTIS